MALSQEELKIVEQMKKLGATNSEISGFIGRSRAGIQSNPPIENIEKRNSAMGIVETGQDIAQGFQNILGIAKKTYGKQTEALNASIEGKQGLARGLGQAFGAGAMGVSEGVGEVVKTGVKAGLTQGGEENVKGAIGAVAQPIVQSKTVQGLIEKYDSLSDIQKRDLGAVLGVVALGAEFLGTGASKTAVKQVAKFIPEGQPFKSVDEVIDFTATQADEVVSPTAQVLKQTEADMPDLSIKEKWIGLEPSFKKKIQGQPEKMVEYINVVKARNNDIDMPSVYEYAGDNARIAVADMERIINSTGSKIGQTRQKLGSYTLDVDQVKAIEKTLVNQVNKLNLNLVEGRIVRDTGKISKISNAELTALQELYQNLVVLKRSPNLTNAIDLRNLFDKNINFGKSAREISGVLDPVSKATREEIAKQTARLVGKSEAKNLADYSDFMRAYDDLKGFTDRNAGGEYLLRVFLSGRGGEASKVIKTIANYTGKDLSVDAVMMKLVTDFFANSTQKNLFAQEITRAGLDATRILAGDATGLIPQALNLAQKKLLDPEDILKEAAGVKKKFDNTKQGGFVRIGKETPTAKPVYRGTGGTQSGKASIYGKGTYFAESKDVASKYGKVSSTKIDTTKFFDGTKTLSQDIQDSFVDRLSKKMNIPKQDILKDIKTSQMFGNEDYYSIISNIEKPKGIKAEVFESDVAEVLNTILKEKGFKGVKGFELANGKFTKNAIYNQFPDSPLPKSKVNESVSSLNDSTLLKEAKKYKSAEEFVNKVDPISFYKVSSREIGGTQLGNYVSIEAFPKEIVKGKGITKSRLLDLMHQWQKEGYERIVAGGGGATKAGEAFNQTLIRDGFLTKNLRFTEKLKAYKPQSQLEQIWKAANKKPNTQGGYINIGLDEIANRKPISGEKALTGVLAGAFSLGMFNKLLSDQMTRTEEKAYREGLSQVPEIPAKEIKLQQFVPEEYKPVVIEATKGLKVRPEEVAALIQTENGMWDEEFVNPQGTDTGLGQHNENTYKDINKLYKKKYGKSYDRKNGEENIKATALWLDHLLEREGINGIEDAIKAYRIGVQGLMAVRQGKGTARFTEQELRDMANDKLESYKQALQG